MGPRQRQIDQSQLQSAYAMVRKTLEEKRGPISLSEAKKLVSSDRTDVSSEIVRHSA
jgi:hypothetical protein